MRLKEKLLHWEEKSAGGEALRIVRRRYCSYRCFALLFSVELAAMGSPALEIDPTLQQGRIHGYISRVRFGRGSNLCKPQNSVIRDQKLDVNRPTDRRTDIASYRVACTRLKTYCPNGYLVFAP